MSVAKQLSEEQRQAIQAWVEEGAELATIQRRLADEMQLKVNYMETRFLVSDLGLELKSEAKKPESKDSRASPSPAEVEAAIKGGSSVQVTVDAVTPPHALIAGRVSFSDGQGGQWFIDQMGQPGLDMDTPGYRPSEDDLKQFQKELRAVIEREQGRLG